MNIRTIFQLIFFVCIKQIACAQTFTPGESYFGTHGYIEYLPGTLPFIISVPHGGYLEPAIMPDRTCGDAVYVNDAYTQELGRAIYQSVYEEFGCYPHMVINLLDRAKMDANRNFADGACDNDSAQQAWQDFNNFLDSAEAKVLADYGRGLYIDLHGHGHTIQRLELGYLLYADELQLSDATLNAEPYVGYSSIQNLVATNAMGNTHAELLRGNNALGTLFDVAGYPSVPSQSDPFPAAADPYFSGGYNTVERSSYSGGTIDGVQIECNMNGVRNTADNRARFADSLASVVHHYLTLHIFPDGLNDCGQTTTIQSTSTNNAAEFVLTQTNSNWIVYAEGETAQVYDISGRLIFTGQMYNQSLNIDVQDWPAGVYLVTVRNADMPIAQQLIVR